jgi:anti-sigma-K factor RskA
LQSTGAGGQGASSFVASVAGDGRSLVTRPVQPVALQAGRVLELWSVPPTGAPKSLGLIRADGSTLVARERLPASLLKGGTAALAVSVEPPGGSPTGAPSGPVVFAGKLQI